jgi:exonuclease SbcD
MLLLHAADLHLGKSLHERDLGPDQEAMLSSLLSILAERRPAALLIAGDLYDRSIPPPEAVRLFDSFLSRAVEAAPGIAVIAIPGNHDSAARLSFGAGIMSLAGVHIRTRPEDCVRPILIERGGERAAVWPLPFLGAGAFDLRHTDSFDSREDERAEGPESEQTGPEGGGKGSQGELDFEAPDRGARSAEASGPAGQAALFAEAIHRIRPLLRKDARNVLVAHCFAAGGRSSESERAFLGSAEQVDAALLSAFDYAALGHLHRYQAVGKVGRYAGSPLAYSFAESEEDKGFVLVDLKASGGFEAEFIPIVPMHVMRRIEGPFSALAAPGAYPEFRDDFVEARLTDAEPVLNPADPLRANFPNLLSVRQAAFELAAADESGGGIAAPCLSEGQRSVAEDFSAFHAEMLRKEADEETMRLFASLCEEASRETL